MTLGNKTPDLHSQLAYKQLHFVFHKVYFNLKCEQVKVKVRYLIVAQLTSHLQLVLDVAVG